MSFPEDNLAVLTELKVGSVDWANVTSDVRQTSPIVITRGRSEGASGAEAANCSFVLNNRHGRYSPRNPTSPLYGLVGRNTPIRISLGKGAYGMVLAGGNGRGESADSVALSPTGDLDVRVDMEILATDESSSSDVWTSGGSFQIASKFRNADVSRAWSFLLVGGQLQLNWFSLGTVASHKFATSIALTGDATGRRAVRVVLDVDNGLGGWTVRFYQASTIAGPWTQIGSDITGAGTTAIFDSDGLTRIGANPDLSLYSWNHAATSTVYSAEIRSGAALVASPNFAGQPLDPVPFALSNFTDAQGNVWFFNGDSDQARTWYGDVDVRFHGEIAELPPRWDTSGRDAWVPVRAAGLLRRIGQGKQPTNSGVKQFLMNTSPVSYWPLDEGGSTREGNNVAGTYPFYKFVRSPELISTGSMTFGNGDLGTALPAGISVVHTGTTGGYMWAFCLGQTTSPTSLAAEFVYKAEALGEVTYTLRTRYTGATSDRFDDWNLELNGDGTSNDFQLSVAMDVTASASSIASIGSSGAHPAITDGDLHHVRVQLTQDGADVDCVVYVDGVAVITATHTAWTLGGSYYNLLRYPPRAERTALALGHLILWEGANIPAIAATSSAAHSFTGEAAGRRLERLTDELDIPFIGVGDLDETLAMGPQYTDYFSNQLIEIEQTDMGILYEPRDEIAIGYRTRASLYNQDPVITVDLSQHELNDPFEPVDDDQLLRNDIFAQRREGGSYQATLESGPLSVQDPPNGASRYKDEVPLNVESDDMLPAIGGWLLHLGTVDEARYPHIVINRANPNVVANPDLFEGVLAVDVGSLAVLTNAANRNIHDDVPQLVVGMTETLNAREHVFDFTCVPGSPYLVAELDDDDVRVDPGDDSTLTSAIDSDDTALSVTSINGTLWTTSAGDMPIPILVGGEEMTVTAISGASSPQTFTVTRSANGVTKSHAAGALIRLKRPAVLAL